MTEKEEQINKIDIDLIALIYDFVEENHVEKHHLYQILSSIVIDIIDELFLSIKEKREG